MIFEGTISNGHDLYYHNSTFISPIYNFPWRETYMLTRQMKAQIGKSVLIILFIKEKVPTLPSTFRPKQTLFRPFLPSRTASFHLSTEKLRVRSVGNGHQSGYSRADIINNNINK